MATCTDDLRNIFMDAQHIHQLITQYPIVADLISLKKRYGSIQILHHLQRVCLMLD